MRIPLAGQLAAAFAVPIVALVLVAGSVSLGFAQLDSAKQELAAKGGLRAKVQHVARKITLLRFATRGYVLTGKSRYTTERIEAMNAVLRRVRYAIKRPNSNCLSTALRSTRQSALRLGPYLSRVVYSPLLAPEEDANGRS